MSHEKDQQGSQPAPGAEILIANTRSEEIQSGRKERVSGGAATLEEDATGQMAKAYRNQASFVIASHELPLSCR